MLIGYDNQFNYKKLCLLSLYAQKGIKFFSTNPDKATMMEGYRMPGCVSIVKSI
jgi:ribonucleotide monophosphatase NagD (HAD superfamily)